MEKAKETVVCILTFNRLKYLKETINSVINSSYTEYSLIVVDNNSNDGTENFLIEEKSKGNLDYIRHARNIGMGGSANYILDNIKCKYLLMLHDDDLLEKNYLRDTINLIKKDKNIIFVGTGYSTIDDKGKVLSAVSVNLTHMFTILSAEEYILYHLQGLSFPWSGTLLNRSLIKKQIFDYKTHPYAADAFFMLEIIGSYKVGYIRSKLFKYRIYKGSTTTSLGTDYNVILDEWFANFKKYNQYLKRFPNSEILECIHKKSTTITLFNLLMKCKSSDQYCRIVNSRYFQLYNLSFINRILVVYKKVRLIVRV